MREGLRESLYVEINSCEFKISSIDFRIFFVFERGAVAVPKLDSAQWIQGLLKAPWMDVWSGADVSWTPFQRQAIEAGAVEGREHWFLSAPAGAGKSRLGELIATCSLRRGERVVWLVPTRALAEETVSRLRKRFGALGVRIAGGAAGGRGAKRWDVMVCIYEAFAAWMAGNPHRMADVGRVVVDEAGTLADPQRGGGLDRLIARLLSQPYQAALTALATGVETGDAIKAWWPGKILVSRERPIPLEMGVLDLESGTWRHDDGGGERIENFAYADAVREAPGRLAGAHYPDDDHAERAALAAALALAELDGPTLLFATSRAQARRWCAALMEAAVLPAPEGDELDTARRRAESEPATDHDLFLAGLGRGVAMHHADLDSVLRAEAERLFGLGLARLMICTPTLAQGVNLPAHNVVGWPWRFERGEAGVWREVPLERSRLLDQFGRAGRLGMGAERGRAMFAACGAAHAEALWRLLRPGRGASLEPGAPFAPGVFALNALAGDQARSPGRLADEARRMLIIQMDDEERDLEEEMREALEALEDAGLARRREGGAVFGIDGGVRRPVNGDELYCLAAEGRLCVRHGVAPEDYPPLRALVGGLPPETDLLSALWALAAALPSSGWESCLGPERPDVAAAATDAVRERLDALPEYLRDPLPPWAWRGWALGWRMAQWIGPRPNREVEAATGWPLGTLARAGVTLAWLARSAAAVAGAHSEMIAAQGRWRELAARLACGAAAEAVGLAILDTPSLGRETLQRMAAAGYDSAGALVEAPVEALAALAGDEAGARRTIKAAFRILSRREMDGVNNVGKADKTQSQAPSSPFSSGPSSPPPLLEIDLQSPGVVLVEGREVRLSPLDFDLLAALAREPGRVLTRQSLYHTLWPEGGPEEQQLNAHRRRLVAALRPALGEAAPAAARVVRGVGYRLELPPSHVRVVGADGACETSNA